MPEKIFCYIPEAVVSIKETGPLVRELLANAIAARVKPATLPRLVKHIAVLLDESHVAHVKALGRELGLAPGRVVGGLIYAMHLLGCSKTATGNNPNLRLEGLRSSQITCLEAAAPLLAKGKIILTEAGTGSGKSRLIAHAAAYALSLRDAGARIDLRPVDITHKNTVPPLFLREFAHKAQAIRQERLSHLTHPEPKAVLVAAPSIENVVHLIREWQTVAPTIDPDKKIRTAVVFGRAQFVSESKLNLLLDELDEDIPDITMWLRSGMTLHYTDSTQALAREIPNIRGLMADLEQIAANTAINAADAALDDDCFESEAVLYQRLRGEAMDADLVFTTTAMLCMDNIRLTSQTTSNLLPYPWALFIDEAHTLESVQSAMCASSLSFLRLTAELRAPHWKSLLKNSPSAFAISCVNNAASLLADIPNMQGLPIHEDNAERSVIHAWQQSRTALDELLKALNWVMEDIDVKKPGLTPEQLKSIKYVRQAVYTLDNIKAGWRGHIAHSSKKHKISFHVGPQSIQKYLVARWETTPMCMLLSGTLAHLGSNGASFSAIKAELGISPDREGYTAPIHPSWLHSTPTLYTPDVSVFHNFVPPSGIDPDPESMTYWLSWCAKAIAVAADDAKGGTLVLMTSYERVELLSQIIEQKHPHLASRLITQDRRQRISSLAEDFKRRARNDERPIWIATGPAWTGLDLSDTTVSESAADQDHLLTDVIMPNLPFGLDRSTTHVARMARIGFGTEIVAVQRKFRQGIGRLVRRDGLKDRRIWILDGRLQHPAAKMYMADMQRVLNLYLHRRNFVV